MVLDRNLLRAEFAKNGLTQEEVARKIGMNPTTFARKIKKSGFYTEEACRLIDVLNIKSPEQIFFAKQ